MAQNKRVKIFGEEIIDPKAINQLYEAMESSFAIRGALMPDAHLGYSLPIGGIIGTHEVLVPAWVGYDIGCGVCAVKTTFDAYEVKLYAEKIYQEIYKRIPVGFKHHDRPLKNTDLTELWRCSEWFKNMFNDKRGMTQLATLGGGNHFIEIGVGQDENVWIVVHSGSRNVGHSTASHYMALAANSDKPKDGHYPLYVDSFEGDLYKMDMEFCLNFALMNRKLLVLHTSSCIREFAIGSILMGDGFINRNHNHAEYDPGLQMWIHRKGAIHAKKGMGGVIPGNMRDGSYIVEGRGSIDSLYSSSHGAGRRLSRSEAKKAIDIETFEADMADVQSNVSTGTIDEAPGAYKDIKDVMHYQRELVDIVNHIKPIINIKG